MKDLKDICFEAPTGARSRGRPQKSKKVRVCGAPIKPKEQRYEKMTFISKVKTLLRQLVASEDIPNILNGELIIKKEDLQHLDAENLSDTFIDSSVNINVLRKYLKPDALEFLEQLIEKKDKEEFTCDVCRRDTEGESVQCETCLCWFHCDCVNFKRSSDSWFCTHCTDLFAEKHHFY